MLDALGIDPNVLLGSIVVGALGWLWSKVRGGDKQGQSLRATVEAIITAEVEAIAGDAPRAAAAADFLEEAAWRGLAKLKIKRNAITELLVAELVARGVAEVRKRINERAAKRIPAQMAALLDKLKPMAAAFDQPDGSVPDLDRTMFDVTIVDADPVKP